MAAIKGIKVRKKKERITNPLMLDEKYTGYEPEWDNERALKMPDAEFEGHMRKSMNYYNYFYSWKDMKPTVVAWLKETTQIQDGKKWSEALRKSDTYPVVTCGSLIRAWRKGMPLKQNAIDFIMGEVSKAIRADKGTFVEADVVKAAKAAAKAGPVVPNIQDRMNEKASLAIGELEGTYDEVVRGKVIEPKAASLLEANKVPQQVVGRIKKVFEQRKYELSEAQAGQDAQLKEAYAHYKAKDYKRHAEFLDKLLGELAQYTQLKKVARKVRAKKAPTKDKQVSKIKFCKSFGQLKIASIPPQDIIGATKLWIYNTKYRKLGCYVADSHMGTLGVKGASIVGFDETKSVCKTLRKPEEQLAAFAKANKVALRTFLQGIKATEARLNGRINAEIVLLKVE